MLQQPIAGATVRWMKGRVQKAVARDRRVQGRVLWASKRLWPWREVNLAGAVAGLALLDYLTTIAALEIAGREAVYERGILAGWALKLGGAGWLLLVDAAAVAALLVLAFGIRWLCYRIGFDGFGRASFVLLLWPYAVVALAAVVNNLILSLA